MTGARHDLLWVDEAGRDFALSAAQALRSNVPKARIEALIRSGVPAIVRRQEEPREDVLEVGFSSHEYVEGGRLRVSAEIPVSSVTRAVTPFELPRLYDWRAHPRGTLLERLFRLAGERGLTMGIYGSTALQLVTGLPYSRPDSDLDLLLRQGPGSQLEPFYRALEQLQRATGVRLDAELEIRDGYAVKLAELFSDQKTVLAKGYDGAKLLRISEVMG